MCVCSVGRGTAAVPQAGRVSQGILLTIWMAAWKRWPLRGPHTLLPAVVVLTHCPCNPVGHDQTLLGVETSTLERRAG